MKRIASLVCMLILCISIVPLFSGCVPRELTLRILNWADYIDLGDDEGGTSIIKDFEQWYYDTFDEKIKVKYRTVETNEDMYNKVVNSKMDYDLICPSDYMIEKMYREEKLIKFDFSTLPSEVTNNIGNISSYITDNLAMCLDDTGKINDYFVGYMWGTMGILYNRELLIQAGVPANQVDSFVSSINALWGKTKSDTVYDNLKDQIWMKKSMRDTYIAGALYANQTKANPFSFINAVEDSDLNSALDALKEQKAFLKGYEVDEGKTDMIAGRAAMSFQWAGDAKYCIDEAAAEHDRVLEYSVPSEGSNVFFDGWVMPMYAKNTRLAQIFVNYLCDPENAIRNMNYIGYTTCVGTQEVLDEFTDDSITADATDLSYFFGSGALAKVDNIYYPTLETLQRCEVMRDFGQRNEAVKQMWSQLLAHKAPK